MLSVECAHQSIIIIGVANRDVSIKWDQKIAVVRRKRHTEWVVLPDPVTPVMARKTAAPHQCPLASHLHFEMQNVHLPPKKR